MTKTTWRAGANGGPRAALALLLGCTGCSGPTLDIGGEGTRVVSPADFADDESGLAARPAAPGEPGPEPGPPGPPLGAEPTRPLDPAALVVRAAPGRPEPTETPPEPVEAPVLVEAKLGDINGRAIYASSFFAPMEDRLRAEARTMTPEQWFAFASEEIRLTLRTLILDELLRAEALSLLDPEQRQGLRAFLEKMRDDLISRNYGSESLARERLAEDGVSMEEALSAEEERQLVRLALRREISRRVNVSWRDIVQRYEQNKAKYNPPPVARFRLIRVPSDNADAVDRVATGLASGTPFADIAAGDDNGFNRSGAGLHETTIEGPFEEAEPFTDGALNEVARSLSPGEWSGPFEVAGRTHWLMLEEIVDRHVPLYEAQLEIEQELLSERLVREQDRYLRHLVERAHVGDLGAIHERLLRVAVERYGPPGLRAGADQAP